MNPEKLAKLREQAAASRIGGKGTPRRKMKKVHKSAGTEDKKLTMVLKKMNVQPIQGTEEVNMFKTDGTVLHFTAPKVQASVQSNTFVISGAGEVKEITELLPGIITQLGPESLNNLRRLAESYQKKAAGVAADDDVPELTESFDETAKI